MEIINKKDVSRWDEVRHIRDELGGTEGIDNPKVDQYVDALWALAKEQAKAKTERLGMEARKSTITSIRRQFALMNKWLELTGEPAKTGTLNTLSIIRDQLLKILPGVMDEIQSAASSGSGVLFGALKYMHDALETGLIPELTYRMTDLLKSCWFDLDENLVLVFNDSFSANSICGIESWRQALFHIAQKPQTFLDVLEQINDKSDPFNFENISTGFIIESLPLETTGLEEKDRDYFDRWRRDKKHIEKSAEIAEDDFKQSLELAFAYGRIEDHEKERLLSYTEALREHFFRFNNFGRFRYVRSTERAEGPGLLGACAVEQATGG
jgi:hypothetical protein